MTIAPGTPVRFLAFALLCLLPWAGESELLARSDGSRWDNHLLALKG